MALTATAEMLGLVHRAGVERSTTLVFAQLSRLIAELVEAHRVTLYAVEDGGFSPLVSEFSSGEVHKQQFERWRRSKSIEGSKLAARLRAGEEVVLVEDPSDMLPPRLVQLYGIQPLLAVGLFTTGEMLGALVVEGDPKQLRETQDEIRELAGIVALALENARTLERERRRTEESEALLEVAVALAESTELSTVLATVARNSARVAGFERGSILLADEAGNLRPVMSQFADGHHDPELWERFRSIRAELPAARHVLDTRQPAAYTEPESAQELNPPIWVAPFNIRSMLLVPLLAWGEPFGVLLLDHGQRRNITPQQMRIALGVATQGAAAIGISQLLQREAEARQGAEEALHALRVRETQQAALAELSQLALAEDDLAGLMDEATRVLAKTLDVDYTKVLELLPDGKALLLKAGVGWHRGLVGTATIENGTESQAGYTLTVSHPVIVEDLATETRFSGPALLTDHGAVSGLSVVIGASDRPYGVLGVHTATPRSFTVEDINSVQSVANVLAGAIERHQSEAKRNEAQRRIQESERRYRRLFQRSPIAMWELDLTRVAAWLEDLRQQGLTDLRGHLEASPEALDEAIELVRVLDANSAAVSLVGAQDVDQLLQGFPPPTRTTAVRQAFTDVFSAMREGLETFQSEFTGTNFAGELLHCVMHYVAGRDGDMLDLSHVIVALADITERMTAEQRLRELVRSKDELIASVSHEIRTPLTAVLGFAQLLHDEAEGLSEDERRELLESLVVQSTDVANIVEDLLVAAKADVGDLSVVKLSVDLRAQAAQVLEGWSQTTVDKIGVAGDHVRCLADPARVRQIIRNLVGNALRYGGPNIRMEVRAQGPWALLAVIDDGEGVPPEESQRIFEKYQRGTQVPGLTAALGLGLGLSRHLARLMDGDLTYRRENEETVFELRLPLAPLAT
ncbi:MAG: GAF domain-containing protein [Acidimicrobiia bacterium]